MSFLEISEEEGTIYDELLTVNAESSLAYLGLGKIKLFEKDFVQAEELVKKGIALILLNKNKFLNL